MTLTVGQFKNHLRQFPLDTDITFGSSTFRKRPLVFYRCKWRGTYLHIETNELDSSYINEPEHVGRTTAGEILEILSNMCIDEDVEVSFGCTIDASPLEFHSISSAVSINLIQTKTPDYVVRED